MFPGWRYFTTPDVANYLSRISIISRIFLYSMHFLYALMYHFLFVNYECRFTLISNFKIKIYNIPYHLYKHLYKQYFNLEYLYNIYKSII